MLGKDCMTRGFRGLIFLFSLSLEELTDPILLADFSYGTNCMINDYDTKWDTVHTLNDMNQTKPFLSIEFVFVLGR